MEAQRIMSPEQIVGTTSGDVTSHSTSGLPPDLLTNSSDFSTLPAVCDGSPAITYVPISRFPYPASLKNLTARGGDLHGLVRLRKFITPKQQTHQRPHGEAKGSVCSRPHRLENNLQTSLQYYRIQSVSGPFMVCTATSAESGPPSRVYYTVRSDFFFFFFFFLAP